MLEADRALEIWQKHSPSLPFAAGEVKRRQELKGRRQEATTSGGLYPVGQDRADGTNLARKPIERTFCPLPPALPEGLVNGDLKQKRNELSKWHQLEVEDGRCSTLLDFLGCSIVPERNSS